MVLNSLLDDIITSKLKPMLDMNGKFSDVKVHNTTIQIKHAIVKNEIINKSLIKAALPFVVKIAYANLVEVKIPSLMATGEKSIEIVVDKLTLLVAPLEDDQWTQDTLDLTAQAAIQKALKALYKKQKRYPDPNTKPSTFSKFMDHVKGRLLDFADPDVEISNLHIRFEQLRDAHNPYAAGIVLRKFRFDSSFEHGKVECQIDMDQLGIYGTTDIVERSVLLDEDSELEEALAPELADAVASCSDASRPYYSARAVLVNRMVNLSSSILQGSKPCIWLLAPVKMQGGLRSCPFQQSVIRSGSPCIGCVLKVSPLSINCTSSLLSAISNTTQSMARYRLQVTYKCDKTPKKLDTRLRARVRWIAACRAIQRAIGNSSIKGFGSKFTERQRDAQRYRSLYSTLLKKVGGEAKSDNILLESRAQFDSDDAQFMNVMERVEDPKFIALCRFLAGIGSDGKWSFWGGDDKGDGILSSEQETALDKAFEETAPKIRRNFLIKEAPKSLPSDYAYMLVAIDFAGLSLKIDVQGQGKGGSVAPLLDLRLEQLSVRVRKSNTITNVHLCASRFCIKNGTAQGSHDFDRNVCQVNWDPEGDKNLYRFSPQLLGGEDPQVGKDQDKGASAWLMSMFGTAPQSESSKETWTSDVFPDSSSAVHKKVGLSVHVRLPSGVSLSLRGRKKGVSVPIEPLLSCSVAPIRVLYSPRFFRRMRKLSDSLTTVESRFCIDASAKLRSKYPKMKRAMDTLLKPTYYLPEAKLFTLMVSVPDLLASPTSAMDLDVNLGTIDISMCNPDAKEDDAPQILDVSVGPLGITRSATIKNGSAINRCTITKGGATTIDAPHTAMTNSLSLTQQVIRAGIFGHAYTPGILTHIIGENYSATSEYGNELAHLREESTQLRRRIASLEERTVVGPVIASQSSLPLMSPPEEERPSSSCIWLCGK